MFPPETSLIPVTITLARFVEANGLTSMRGRRPRERRVFYWGGLVTRLCLRGKSPIKKKMLLLDYERRNPTRN